MSTPAKRKAKNNTDILEASAKKNKSQFSNKGQLALATYQAEYLSASQSGLSLNSIKNLIKGKLENLTDDALCEIETAVIKFVFIFLYSIYIYIIFK